MTPFSERPFYKIYISLIVFVLVIVIGTIGYMKLENYTLIEAVYMTVITISTVGFTEVHPMNEEGRIFTIFLILANIGTFTYFLTQTSAYILDGEFARNFKLYNMKKSINDLEGHIILCGFGRNGQEAARIFRSGNRDFVVIEKAEQRREETSIEASYYLNGDATRDETLLHAGIAKADALITTLPEDADNLFVVLTARELNPKIKIISRASNDSSVKKLRTAGANNVIMPDKIGGAHMATLVLTPDIKEFLDVMATQRSEHFSVEEIASNRTISLHDLNCWAQTGATVLGIKTAEGEYALNPVPQTVIRPGNRVIVMGSKEQLKQASDLLA